MRISAVLFDFDGTLTRPHCIDFPGIKQAIGCPLAQPALEFIRRLTDPAARRQAEALLECFEMEAAARSLPNDGAEACVSRLREMGVPMVILTRNCRQSILRAMENFTQITLGDFLGVLTRDDGHEPKPHPAGMRRGAELTGVPVAELLCVGDYVFDVQGAANAGAGSVYLTNGEPVPAMLRPPDFVVNSLAELPVIVAAHQ